MAHELTTAKTGELVQALDKQGLGEMLKPLIREIHLFDTYVAGTTHLEDKTVLDGIKTGDKLTLRREVNKFDDNAILILTEKGKKLGYVPERDNLIFSRLMEIVLARIRRTIELYEDRDRDLSLGFLKDYK